MPAIRSQHARELALLVAARRQELLESLVIGHPADIYMAIIGEVRGLDAALALSEAADFKLNGGEETDASS